MVGGGGGRGGDYFKYFSQRGAIIRGRRLIEGWLLFNEIQYFVSCYHEVKISLWFFF